MWKQGHLFRRICVIIILVSVIIFGLNYPVTTKRGIDYRVEVLKIPLYLKIAEFLSRDYHYKKLTKDITFGCKNDTEKALKIFKWVTANIKKTPEGFKVIDDHIWNIIVRGYGAGDQFSDVFVTLCVYAGIPAFRGSLSAKDSLSRILVSYVRLNGCWVIFDPYYKIYFKKEDGNLACVDDILRRPQIIEENVSNSGLANSLEYAKYYNNLKAVSEPKRLKAWNHMPFRRFFNLY